MPLLNLELSREIANKRGEGKGLENRRDNLLGIARGSPSLFSIQGHRTPGRRVVLNHSDNRER